MPRAKDIESCIFCEPDEPCPSHQPKKSAAPKKRKPSVPSPSSAPSVAAPASDPTAIHAAMRAHAQGSKSEDEVLMDSKVRWITRDEYDRLYRESSREFEAAVQALGPILHPDEHRRYARILDTPQLRAQRWRERHAERH